jgi:Contractile injection system tube protein/LysM domain
MAPPSGFEHAKIEVDGESSVIECWFNPTEYSISKTNLWEFKPGPGKGLPPAEFAGGMPRQLSLELFFDSTDSDKDVRDVTNRLLKMMEVNGGGRPPLITFTWGATNSFKAVPQSLNLRYSLFQPDGSPLRAHATLQLAQAEKTQDASSPPGGTSGGGNPTTRGIDAIGTHVVRDGDSLQSIAFNAYGDATQWRPIAEANGIDDPLSLRRGSRLAIPRSPE